MIRTQTRKPISLPNEQKVALVIWNVAFQSYYILVYNIGEIKAS